MEPENTLFICSVCFRVCETHEECHTHQMLECDPGELGDERRKPVKDRYGNMVSRAPRWFLEAMGVIPGSPPLD